MNNLIFVYGTLKNGYSNHSFLNNSLYYGKAITLEKYLLIEQYLPYLIKSNNEKSTYITGEVYLVNNDILRELDILESHPDFYQREEIIVKINNIDYKCWCYFLNSEIDLKSGFVLNGIY